MTIAITLGWWVIPAAITLFLLAGAICIAALEAFNPYTMLFMSPPVIMVSTVSWAIYCGLRFAFGIA